MPHGCNRPPARTSKDGDEFASLEGALPEARRRLADWRSLLSEETPQARQMLRTLLAGRIVFTPRPELPAVDFAGRGDYSGLFAGLINSEALASPGGTADGWPLPVRGFSDLNAA